MLPQSEELLLEDEAIARTPRKRPVWIRVMIPLLLLCLILVLILVALRSNSSGIPDALQPGHFPIETDQPKTGTFVDNLSGAILFFDQGALREITLPGRVVSDVIGVLGEEEQPLKEIPVVWSADGALLAVVKDAETIVITEYSSGRFLHEFKLRSPLEESTKLVFSIAPSNDVMVIGTEDQKNSKENLLFFDVIGGREMGFFDRCQAKGVWIPEEGFVAKCQLGDLYSVVMISFDESSAQMVPIARDTKDLKYLLLDSYSGTLALIGRQKSNSLELGTLSRSGRFTPLSAKERASLPTPESALNFYESLAKRIEQQTGLKSVTDVSVSSDNSWLTFSSEGNIYVAEMSLKESPFLLTEGKYARVRPY